MGIKQKLHKNLTFMYLYNKICVLIQKLFGDVAISKYKFKKTFGRELDLNDPKALNEKIMWMKLFDHKNFYTIVADKYAVREWLKERFGEEHLVPLLFYTEDWREINESNIPETPCIVKANNGSGAYEIIRQKSEVNWKQLRRKCKYLLKFKHYYYTQEWQYKNMKPYIIVEKLLQTSEGKIPNDYKLHFFNGKLEFVYCSVDREGGNYRNIYDENWLPLHFSWVPKSEYRVDLIGPDITPPKSFDKMKQIGAEIAKLFDYVRVDFYDVDGRLYYGEITLHHGSGLDVFEPEKFDQIFGEKLRLGGLTK